jgi:hypothetical protein
LWRARCSPSPRWPASRSLYDANGGRDIAELSSFDGQLLRDIGIRRGEIRWRLRSGDAGRSVSQSTASAPADAFHAALMPFPSASDWR